MECLVIYPKTYQNDMRMASALDTHVGLRIKGSRVSGRHVAGNGRINQRACFVQVQRFYKSFKSFCNNLFSFVSLFFFLTGLSLSLAVMK